MKKIRLLFALVGLMLGSCILGIVYLNTSSRVREKIESYLLCSLRRDLDCFLSGRLESCNFVTGRFTFRWMQGVSKKNEWNWTAKKMVLSFSWLDFIRFRFFKLYFTFEDFDAYSIMYDTKNIPLFSHIKSFGEMPAGPIPVTLKAAEIRRGQLTCRVNGRDNLNLLTCSFGSCATLVKDVVHVDCMVEKGRFYDAHSTILNEIAGDVVIKISGQDITGEFTGFCRCAFLKNMPRCTVTSNWKTNDGIINLRSCSDDFDAKLDWNVSRLSLAGSVKSSALASFSGIENPALYAGAWSYGFTLPADKKLWSQGSCRVAYGDVISFGGVLVDHQDGRPISVHLTNNELVPLSLLGQSVAGEIKPHDAHVECTLDTQTGALTGKASAWLSEQTVLPAAAHEPARLGENENKPSAAIHGTVSLEACLAAGKVRADFSFKDGQLSSPHLYNSVHAITVKTCYDMAGNMLTVTKGHIDLTKGTIEIPQSTFSFVGGKPVCYTFTLLPHDCFAHFKKEMAASLSGSIIFSKTADRDVPTITGDLIIETGQIKSTFLSLVTDRRSSVFGIMPVSLAPSFGACLNLKLRSREPLLVHTPMLDGSIRCNLTFGGTILSPVIQGDIDFIDGSLQFPYQPLHITHGRISFLPNQLNNPAIEITTQNKIKKYIVTLTVSGFLKQPRISLGSSPSLSEKQIVALLLGGSDSGSLYMSMPALFNATLKDFIFGSSDREEPDNQEGFFKKWLKGVRVVPGLKQSESGAGVLGALTIEVDDNVRATVQKNLNRSGESSIEVEYDLSDDMLVRAVKDERGEIGAEIEKTWKFS